MVGWVDRCMDRWVGGWLDGWVDGYGMGGRIDHCEWLGGCVVVWFGWLIDG